MPVLLEKKKYRGRLTLVFEGAVNLEFIAGDPRPDRFVVGGEYACEVLAELRDKINTERAEKFLTNKLSHSPRSAGQARALLRERSYPPHIIRATIDKFMRVGYLDDRRFGEAYARSMLAERPAGRGFISATLRKKLIDSELVREIVDELFSDVDEAALAERLLKKQWWRLSGFDIETARQKGFALLARRSISYDASREAFDKLAESEPKFSEQAELIHDSAEEQAADSL